MASYQRNQMFGQDSSYDQGWDYDSGWSDYSGEPSTPSYTSEPEGSGLTGAQWANVGMHVLDTLGHIIQPDAYQQPVDAGYYQAPPSTPVYRPPATTVSPGSVAATGSINSTVLLAGGLGLAALFFFRKR